MTHRWLRVSRSTASPKFRADGSCADCEGSGWWYFGPARCLDGIVRWFGWVVCATCNDDGMKPKPRVAPMPREALS